MKKEAKQTKPASPTQILGKGSKGKSKPRGTSEFWRRLFPYQNMNALEAVNKIGGKRRVESGKKKSKDRNRDR